MSPISIPAAVKARQNQASGEGVGILVDLQTVDGSIFYWSNRAGSFSPNAFLATRIQSAGGTDTLKTYFNGGIGLNGVGYRIRCKVKNQGASTIVLLANLGVPQNVLPGQTIQWDNTVVGDGSSQLQLRFQTNVVGDVLDVIAYQPSMLRLSDNVELITGTAAQFVGWVNYLGAVITLTQGQQNPPEPYSPWVKSAGDFQCSRSMKSDSGNFVVQNVTGNTIDRDVASILKAHEFEGALCDVRFWDLLEDAILDEYIGTLTEPEVDDTEVNFRMVQLNDPNQAQIAVETYTETCTKRFKSVRCGSTSLNPTCSKRFADCTSVERFNGTPAVPPGTTQISPTKLIGNLGGGARNPGGLGGPIPVPILREP